MSTRCQVMVTATGLPWEAESIMLYHHCDGYESYMIPLIHKAFKMVNKPEKFQGSDTPYSNAWHAGRPGKSAAWLCAADPGGFEPETGLDLHSDIEFFYIIECVNKSGGSTAEKPTWNVKVFETGPNWDWDNPRKEDLVLINEGPITKLAKAHKAL